MPPSTTAPTHRPARAVVSGLLLALAGLAPAATAATTWYVHPEGGDATQCDGRSERPYPGRGSGHRCAWQHPFIALPPGGQPRIAGGDTLLVLSGEYAMGLGAPGAENCHAAFSWDCHMPPLPSGPAPDQPTRLLGSGHDNGCTDAPRLWGRERAAVIINIDGTRNATLACLEITDGSSCIEFHCHGGNCRGDRMACKRDQAPFGDWAATGIFAQNAQTLVLRDLHIHGLATHGVLAGGLDDWRIERVRIIANGWAGWNGDIGPASANQGRLHFIDVEIAYNGCAETRPDGDIVGCWAQSAGGYGDGLGTASTGGDWLFERVHIHHNTSDGLDLLYLEPGATVRIDASLFEGNAGNQVKIAGAADITNSIIIGHCNYFAGHRNLADGDHCRAAGDALFLGPRGDSVSTLAHNSITGEGNCLFSSVGDGGAARMIVHHNLFLGQPALGRGRPSCLFHGSNGEFRIDWQGNLIGGVHQGACPRGNHCTTRVGIVDAAIDHFDPTPLADSPLVAGATSRGGRTLSHDFLGRERPRNSPPSIGALEPGRNGNRRDDFERRLRSQRPRVRPRGRRGIRRSRHRPASVA